MNGGSFFLLLIGTCILSACKKSMWPFFNAILTSVLKSMSICCLDPGLTLLNNPDMAFTLYSVQKHSNNFVFF